MRCHLRVICGDCDCACRFAVGIFNTKRKAVELLETNHVYSMEQRVKDLEDDAIDAPAAQVRDVLSLCCLSQIPPIPYDAVLASP